MKQKSPAREDNKTLMRLMKEDQHDRKVLFQKGPDQVTKRDEQRRKTAIAMLHAGQIKTALDHFNAGLLFQHGLELSDYKRAHRHARNAIKIGGIEDANWLYAVTLDRMLVAEGKKQKFGTQFKSEEVSDGHSKKSKWVMRLAPFDARTSDRTRSRYGVSCLKELVAMEHAYTKQLNVSPKNY